MEVRGRQRKRYGGEQWARCRVIVKLKQSKQRSGMQRKVYGGETDSFFFFKQKTAYEVLA